MNTLFYTLYLAMQYFMNPDPLEVLAGKMEKFNQTYPQEKVYLQTDKPQYVAGETIWFKAYLVEGLTNRPDKLSIPLYIDLIDPSAQKLMARRILKLERGKSQGNFSLPDSLKGGSFTLRAYTHWMRNFDQSQFFTKNIEIYPLQATQEMQQVEAIGFDFQFFPEGGNLLENYDNRIAFKATRADQSDFRVSGHLVTTAGDTVQSFQSEHQGMGFFYFKPLPGITYQAIVRCADLPTQTLDFPQAKSLGVAMVLDNISNKNLVRLTISRRFNTSDLLIIGQSRGVPFYAGRIPAGDGNVFVTIPKEKFPSGVAQITIFDTEFRPYAERLLFIPQDSDIRFTLTSQKPAYQNRELAVLEIEAKDSQNNPVQGDFSLVVSDESQVKGQDQEESIGSYLLLSSDVKGNVQNPRYYFDPTNRKAAYHLDMLLMTQGWRRFTWTDVLQSELAPTPFFIEQGLTITGQATKPNGKSLGKEMELSMVLGKDSTQQFFMGDSDKNGIFLFSGLDFKDSCDVVLQATLGDESIRTKLLIHPQTYPIISSALLAKPPRQTSANPVDFLRLAREALALQKKYAMDGDILLNEVLIKAKKRTVPEKDSRVLYSRAEAVVQGDASKSALNVLELIRGRVSGVTVTGDRLNPKVLLRTSGQSLQGSAEPLFLIDGAPVSMETLLALDINQVDRVEIVKSLQAAVMYGEQAKAGIISVFTKTGTIETGNGTNSDGIALIRLQGYHQAKEFYAPRYDESKPEHIRPDFRSTVLWLSNIQTDASGKAQVKFFTTDATTTLRVQVEGLTETGLMGTGSSRIQVKAP